MRNKAEEAKDVNKSKWGRNRV